MYKTKGHITKLLFIFALLAVFTGNKYAQTWPHAGMQGHGTESNPWQIRTAQELHALALFVNANQDNANSTEGKHYRIMNDIDLTEFLGTTAENPQGWLPIGKGLDVLGNGRHAFKGFMHGGGHVISGLRINRHHTSENLTENFFVGLFGVIENATIDSLGVVVAEGDSVRGDNFTGILVGASYWNSTIEQVYTKGNVSGQLFVGGLAGHLAGSRVENSYSVANVFGSSEFTGGLIGQMYFGGSVKYSYAIGNVEAFSGAGGLIGYVRLQSPTVQNVFTANSNVTGEEKAGKIIGDNFGATPILSHIYASDATTVVGSGGFNNGTNQTLAEFKSENFFTTAAHWTGGAWNFNTIWIMEPDGFPVFRWQNLVEIPIIPDIYTILASAGNGGTIMPSGAIDVEAGSDTTFRFTPNAGFEIDSVWINNIYRSDVTTSYTFVNVQAHGDIHVTFRELHIDPILSAFEIVGDNGVTITPAFDPNVFTYEIDLGCDNPDGNTYLFLYAANPKDTIRVGNEYFVGFKHYIHRNVEGNVDIVEVRVINTVDENTYRFTIRMPYDSVRILRPFPNVLEVINNPLLLGGQEFLKDQYQWLRNGAPITDLVSNRGVLYLGAGQTVGNHVFSVNVTHVDGTTNRICPTSWSVAVNSLEVYPNPTMGHLSVKAAETFEKQPSLIEIFTIDGKLVEVFNSTGDITDLNLTHLPRGTYVIRQNGQSAIVLKQ